MRVFPHRLLGAQIGESQREGQGRVVECNRRGSGDGSGHVGDAIMNDPVNLIDGIVVGGCSRRLETAALVDRDVD